MSTPGRISFTLVAPNISSFWKIPSVCVGIHDDSLFLFESIGQNRTPTAILERKQVDEAMAKVFQQCVFYLEGKYDDTQENLIRDAINASDFDYRFSTKDAPNHWLEYGEILVAFRRLRSAPARLRTGPRGCRYGRCGRRCEADWAARRALRQWPGRCRGCGTGQRPHACHRARGWP